MRHDLTLPIDHKKVRTLCIGDTLYLSGGMFTARDQAHKLMLDLHDANRGIPFDPSQMALYHCGPIVKRQRDGWKIVSAGPTTSIRMELIEDRFLEAFRPPIIIGKGGMGDRTRAALQAESAVYAHYTGGAGALAAERIETIMGVEWLETLGMPEAVWLFRVKQFGPLLITMDATGGDLYKDLDQTVADRVAALFALIDGV